MVESKRRRVRGDRLRRDRRAPAAEIDVRPARGHADAAEAAVGDRVSTIQTGLLMLTEVRARAAAALAPIDDTDPPLLPEWVDAFHPPVLMLDWNTPWLEPGVGFRRGMGPCVWQAGLAVLCAASRVEPGAGMEQLEQLVTHTVRRLQADTSY